MGLLERFEDSLDRMVNGAFARAFKAEVQPVEIAAALQREIDDRAAVTGRDRTVIPNIFNVELSDHDYKRLAVFRDALQTELGDLVKAYGTEQQYTLLGSVHVRSEARAEVSAKQVGGDAPIGEQPRLVLGDTAYPLVRAITRLGRGSETDIRVEDPGCSRNHCEIILGQPALVRDLGSTNGTFVNGAKITEAPIEDGGSVSLGSTTLVFRSG